MNEDDVTRVTRNDKGVKEEVKLVIDLLATAALMYYATHPDCLDKVGEHARRYWNKLTHAGSVWAARLDIRSLPETDVSND